MLITPDAAISYSTIAMLFGTPIAVIVGTILQSRERRALAKASKEVKETLSQSTEKLDAIHDMVNDNLEKAIQKSDEMASEIRELTGRLAMLAPEDFMASVRAVLAAHDAAQAKKNKAK